MSKQTNDGPQLFLFEHNDTLSSTAMGGGGRDQMRWLSSRMIKWGGGGGGEIRPQKHQPNHSLHVWMIEMWWKNLWRNSALNEY